MRNEHWILQLESAPTKKLDVCMTNDSPGRAFIKINIAIHISCIPLSPFITQWAVSSVQGVSWRMRTFSWKLSCLYCTHFLSVLQSVILPTDFTDWFFCVWVVGAGYRGKDAGEAAFSSAVMLLRQYF